MSTPTPTPAPPDVALDSPARAASFRTTASGTGSTRTLSGLRSRLSSKLKGHRHTESAPAGWAPSSDDSTAFDPASEPAQGGAADIQDSAARGRPGHARNFSSASAASVGQAPPVVARAAHAVAQLAGMNPITAQRQLIVGTLVATALAAQLLSRLLHWSVGLMAIGVGAHLLLSKLDIAARDSAWERETATRESQPHNAESAEWINHVLGVVWPLISTDYFVPFVDLLEDALMQQVPGIVHGCRVDGLDQGTIPLRIVGFTRLPSHEEAFLHGADAKHNVSEAEETLSDVGDFVNLEVSFAYRAPRARRKMASSNKAEGLGSEAAGIEDEEIDSSAAEQIHLLIYMAIGLQKLAAVEVPVWIEMLGIEGKMRLRLQLTPAAPFVKHVAFCFVGAPRIEISAKPLGRRMVIDAMNLPLISSYVLRSIEAVIRDFIAPQSYSIDAGALLSAADGPQNVYALGVLVVVLHRATDLPAADVGGTSDPFIKISFARAGKPLYMSRVLVKTVNPVWGETAFLLVGPDEVRDHERMRLGVFDADRFSSDDELGHVDVSIARLIRRSLHKESDADAPSLIEDRDDPLVPPRRGAVTSGRLRYSVAFCRLAQPTSGGRSAHRQDLLRQAARNAPSSAGAEKTPLSLPDSASYDDKKDDAPIPEHLLTAFDRFVVRMGFPLDDAVMRSRAERAERVARLKALIEGENDATTSAPQPEWPAGILAFHIHSIDGLEVPTTQRNFNNSKRLEKKPRYTTSDEAAGNKATPKFPSSYVQVFLNDEAIFRTRTKALDPRPFINAGAERWVTNWQTARLDFVVRDQRMREADPILGLVGLRIADVLKESSRSTGYYTLTGGLGFGKIRLSLVWRSVELRVPRALSGWNVGVLEISAARVSGLQLADVDDGRPAQLYFETVGGTAETETKEPHAEGTAGATIGYDYPLQQSLRLPVRQRYPSYLYIHLRSDSRVPGRRHKHAHGAIPLNRIADGEGVFKRVQLFASAEWQEIEQHALGRYPPPQSVEKGAERAVLDEMIAATDSNEHPESETLRHVGFVDLTFVYHAGIAQEHRSLVAGDNELRYAFETFLAGIDGGERAKPAKLSPALRRSLSLAHVKDEPRLSEEDPDRSYGSEASTSGNALRVDTGAAEASSKHRAAAAVNPDLMSPEEREEQEGEESDREWEEGNNEVNEDEDDTTPEGRRARQRALHRQHKGAAQIKGYRSLQWVAQNAQDGLGRVKRIAGQQSKKMGKMESEGVSHF